MKDKTEYQPSKLDIVALPGAIALRIQEKEIFVLSLDQARKLEGDIREMITVAEALRPNREVMTVPGVSLVQ